MAPIGGAQVDPPKQQDENFFHWFKPTSEPTPVSPEAHAYEGITQAVTQGTKEGNKFFEDQAKDTGEKEGEKIQTEYGRGVEATWEKVTGKTVGEPGKDKPDTLLPFLGDSPDKKQVDEGLQAIDKFRAAKDQGAGPGHIRETEYLASIYKRASQLRAQWPGYRDYIDRGIEKATGITPNANAYIKSMLADINDIVSKKNSADTHVENLAATEASKGNQHAMDALKLKHAGIYNNDQVLQRITTSNLPEHEAKLAQAGYNTLEAGTKTLQVYASNDIRGKATSLANQSAQTWLDGNGLTKERMEKLASGDAHLEDFGIDPRAVAASLNQQSIVHNQRMDNWLDQPVPINGTTTTRRVAAGEKLPEILKESNRVWGDLSNALTNKDFGSIHRIANAVTDINQRALWNVWSGSGQTNSVLRNMKVVTEMGGANFTAAMFGQEGFSAKDLNPTNITAAIGDAAGGFKTQGFRGMKEALETMDKETHGESPVTIRAYLRTLSQALSSPDVKDVNKLNIAEHMFDTKDLGWMSLIKETQDSAGRHNTFNRLTSPEVVKAMQKLRDQGHTDIYNKYDNWVKHTFGQDLFNHDIGDLNGLGNRAGIQFQWHTPPGQAPFFRAVAAPGTYPQEGLIESSQAQRRADKVNSVLTKLNSGIASMHSVYADSTAGMLMNEFSRQGFNLGKPESMANGLAWSMAPKSAPAGSTKPQGRVESTPAPTRQPEVMGSNVNIAPPQGGAITAKSNAAARPWPFTGDEPTHHWQNLIDQTRATVGPLADEVGTQIEAANKNYSKAGEAFQKGFDKFRDVRK